jgi:metal-responsive CopG/Arc/MetJ family transcriptional regulator
VEAKMPNKMYRAQILLQPEQHAALDEIAKEKESSISGIVREILQKYLPEYTGETRRESELEALSALSQIREQAERRYGLYKGDLIGEVREERENQMDSVRRGE